MTAKKKPKRKTWGGYRPNSGRKADPNSKKNINFRLHPKYIKMLKDECSASKMSVSDIIQIAVKSYFVEQGKLPKSELDEITD